ncbi:MAG: tRNA pseudouridine(13) synthase TruD [Aquisalimonadaceae bacterium]
MNPDIDTAWRSLPRAWGAPVLRATVRQFDEDFQVVEELGFTPEGEGEHLYLRIRKTGWNTADVAGWLARALGVRRRDVGQAGLKDRHAVAEQWFGVHMPGRHPDLPPLPGGLELVQAVRHRRKLRTGALKGNRFILRLRNVEGDTQALGRRLLGISRGGVPNWFGEQRFGIDGGNLAAAARLFAGDKVADRHLRGLYLSAARSFLFNRVLAERVAAGSWNRVLTGDLMTFSGSRSLFPADASTTADPRLAALDVHPTGPLAGCDGVSPTADALLVERRVLEAHTGYTAGLVDYRLRAERRALRLSVANLSWRPLEDGDWELSFSLPPGAYATAVLREVIE